MSAITQFFFRPPYVAPSTWSIIRWWESRRLAYNAAVGAAGVVSLSAIALTSVLPPFSRPPGVPWIGIVVYGVLANVFFSAGPALDAFIVRRWGPDYAAVGPALFRYGFAFAVGLTLLPIPVSLIGWGLRVLGAIF
jgi:hypothetical protein